MENIPRLNLPTRNLKNKNKYRFLLYILVGLVLILIIYPRLSAGNKLTIPLNILGISNIRTDNSLENTVNKTMQGVRGTYGIYIKNLKSGESFFINENRVFTAGSLYKLWVMATVYQQIQKGELDKNELLSEEVEVLNNKFNIDPDLAELTEGVVSLSVHDALHQMITISHNYAALLLTSKIKLSKVAAFLQDNGFKDSAVGIDGSDPVSTPFDIALFLEKLYKGELADGQYTKDMVDLLKQQQIENGLSKYLPDQLQVANKTGDIGWFKHDAGIVFSDQGDYIIIVMSESDYPAGAQERIALLSKAVFDYFSAQNQQSLRK